MIEYHVFRYPSEVCDLPLPIIERIRKIPVGFFKNNHVYYMEGDWFIDATNSRVSK